MSIAERALDTVHAHIRECSACPLHTTRTRAVPGSGPASARILALGEAPGEREDLQGEPFVGAAGKLLTRLLEDAGLSRADIFITNTVKCRPPGNRDPLPEEVTACAGFLDAQLEILQPDVILLLGRHAVARVLPGMPGISRIHGELVEQDGRRYVPLYHPAAALYNGSLLGTLKADMQRLRGYLDALRPAAAGDAEPGDSQLSLI